MSPSPDVLRTVDLGSLDDMRAVARFIVFHHPDLLTIDPEAAEKVLGYIEQAPAFASLVQSLNNQGVAVGPDSEYDGWASGDYLLDSGGQKIPDGNGAYYWTYRLSLETRAGMLPAVQEALLAVRDDPWLQGRRYEGLSCEYPVPSIGRAGFMVDPCNGWNGCRVYAEENDSSTVTFRVVNDYARCAAVFARFCTEPGQPIPLSSLPRDQRPSPSPLDTETAAFIGLLPPRPLFLGTPLSGETAIRFSVPIPSVARGIYIVFGSFGRGMLASALAAYGPVMVPGAVLTTAMTFVLPALYLACGTGAQAIQSDFSGVLARFGADLLDYSARPETEQLFRNAAVKSSPDALNTDVLSGVLAQIFKTDSKAFRDVLAWLGPRPARTLAPIVGTVIEALASTAGLAAAEGSAMNASLSAWVTHVELRRPITIPVTINCDSRSYQLPASASRFDLTATVPGRTPTTVSEASFSGAGKRAVGVAVPNLPPLRPVRIEARFKSATGVPVATACATVPAGAQEEALATSEDPAPLTSTTQFIHREKLTVSDSGQLSWTTTPSAPSGTAAHLGGNKAVTLEELAFISVTPNGRLTYGWRARSPQLSTCPAGPASAPVYLVQSMDLSRESAEARVRRMPCGEAAPILLAPDSVSADDQLTFAIVPASNPRTHLPEYQVRKVDLTGSGGLQIDCGPSWGRFGAQRLASASVHPSGVIVALDAASEIVHVLHLPGKPYAADDLAEYATSVGGRGSRPGLLHGAKAVSTSGWQELAFVLEEGNGRVQVLDFSGNAVKYFGGTSSFFPLNRWPEDAGKTIAYLDMKVSHAGYIFILSMENGGLEVSQYRLDVYGPDATKLSRTRGVAAGKLAVDPFHAVYTLNYDLLVTGNQRPEPSISLWTIA